jgi:hypothetical protein
MDTDMIISDGENYRGKEEVFGFKQIVLKQVQRISNVYSKELIEGFLKYSQPNQFGQQEPIAYFPDGRKSYIQSVRFLYDILQPKFDKTMIDDYDNLKIEIEDKGKGINEKVDIMRRLFQKLCLFLERLGWLEETSYDDGVMV